MDIDSGIIKKGDIKIGYFDQNRKMLDDEKNLIETFCPMGGDRIEVRGKNFHVYGYLKQFLFPKEFLDKKIKPMLAMDGGSLELIDIREEDGITKVYVRYLGACATCASGGVTLKAIEDEMKKYFKTNNLKVEQI